VNRRSVIKSTAGTVGGLGYIGSALAEEQDPGSDDIIGGGGSYPINDQRTKEVSKTISGEEIAESVGINLSYYGTFDDNPNRETGTPYFHDFTVGGHGGARRRKSEWKQDNAIEYQAVELYSYDNNSMYTPNNSYDAELGVTPASGSNADYPEAAKRTIEFILSQMTNYYSYVNFASDIVDDLVNTGDDPVDGTRLKWDSGSNLIGTASSDTSNYMRVLVNSDNKQGSVGFKQEISGTSATNQSSISVNLDGDVNDGAISFSSQATLNMLNAMDSFTLDNEEVVLTDEGHPAIKIPEKNVPSGSPIQELVDKEGYVWKTVYPIKFK
jgi:hypothetical protein